MLPWFVCSENVFEALKNEDLEDVSRCAHYGAKKYGKGNWLRGIGVRTAFGSLVRHYLAELAGEEFDAESGLSHRAHAIFNAFMLRHSAECTGSEFCGIETHGSVEELLNCISIQFTVGSKISLDYIEALIIELSRGYVSRGSSKDPEVFRDRDTFVSEGDGALKDFESKVRIEHAPFGTWGPALYEFIKHGGKLQALSEFCNVCAKRYFEKDTAFGNIEYVVALEDLAKAKTPLEKLIAASELSFWEAVLPNKCLSPIDEDVMTEYDLARIISKAWHKDRYLAKTHKLILFILSKYFGDAS